MGNLEHALSAYEHALRHNSHSLPGLTQVAGIARIKENYPKVRFPGLNSIPASSSTCLPLRPPDLSPGCLRPRPFPQAVEYFQAALQVQGDNGEVWSALGTSPRLSRLSRRRSHPIAGHCYLMQDDLQKAYAAYQQALYFLPNPKVRLPSPDPASIWLMTAYP